jgi:hypothetical protein
MIIVPLQALANQQVSTVLGGQNVVINIYQKGDWLYIDIQSNGVWIRQCRMVLNCVLLVRYAYLGFLGDLAVVDTQGSNDPVYTGLGSRYLLVYLSQTEVAAL